ncbi:MAG TPA: GAF domain-containing protein, partial [Gaiellaceae bacterium]|nr:GAF domain-containing protein [Gaiellaceae bacterium]
MSQATKAVLFNGVPLLLLAAAYSVVTGAILPILWRNRRQAHPLDWSVVLVFPCVAVAAGIFGVLVLYERRPVGGHVWPSFAASLVALAPAVLLLARWRDRALVVGGIGRTREAEERVSERDRELEGVAEISNALARARTPVDAVRPLVRHVTALLGVGFAGVVVVADGDDAATGVYAELNGEPAEWWEEMRVDLRNEPSGIASAVFDAAPVTVYDIASSSRVSARLAAMVGAHSGAWVPMIADGRVAGVLVFASTDAKRTFPPDELAVLQAIASEAALALERLRSASALADALARE